FYISREGHLSSVGKYAIRKTLDPANKSRLTKLLKHLYYFGIEERIRQSMPPQVYASLKSVQSLSSLVSATLTSNSELRKFSQKAQSKSTQKQELIGWFACIYLIGVAVSISALLVE